MLIVLFVKENDWESFVLVVFGYSFVRAAQTLSRDTQKLYFFGTRGIWGDGGGGHWLVRMEWRPAGWSVCLPLLIFQSRSSLLALAHPGGP